VVVLALVSAGYSTGCEQPLKPTSISATLSSVQVACAPRDGTPTTHAFCQATACFSDNSLQSIVASAVWQSSNPVVATVERGIVEYRSMGGVTITATYSWKGGTPVTGAHPLTITELGCALSDPGTSRLCDGALGGIPGLRAPATCPFVR